MLPQRHAFERERDLNTDESDYKQLAKCWILFSPRQTKCDCYSNPIEKWKFKVNVRFHVHLKLSWLNWIEKNKYALHFFSRQIFLREVFKYHLETSLRRILKNTKLIEYLFLSRRHFHCHISSDLTKLWTAITPV